MNRLYLCRQTGRREDWTVRPALNITVSESDLYFIYYKFIRSFASGIVKSRKGEIVIKSLYIFIFLSSLHTGLVITNQSTSHAKRRGKVSKTYEIDEVSKNIFHEDVQVN